MGGITSLYGFETLSKPVALENCSELIPIIKAVMPDWHIHEWRGSKSAAPDITIQKTANGFVRRSSWVEKTRIFNDPVAAVCDLIVDLVHAYIAERPDLLCLHSAAVAFNDGLVLFPSTYRAGKSTLTTKLASVGGRVYADDVIPLEKSTGSAFALGILPRLRLPIPANSDAPFREFVATHSGPKSDRYLYVDLTLQAHARLGENQPICGIVVLQRDQKARPSIELANKGEVLREVILRNFARQGAALEIVDLLHLLVEENDCYILRYSTLEEASTLLLDTFGHSTQAGVRGGVSYPLDQ